FAGATRQAAGLGPHLRGGDEGVAERGPRLRGGDRTEGVFISTREIVRVGCGRVGSHGRIALVRARVLPQGELGEGLEGAGVGAGELPVALPANAREAAGDAR